MSEKNFEDQSVSETLESLNVNPERGLTEEEVKQRVKAYGYNEIPEKKESVLKRLGKKFWGLTAWMLEITMVIELFIRHYIEVYVIAALLVLNALIGFVHEERASRALELLKQRLQVMARVLRNGSWSTIPAREVVPGDIVRVRAGDVVPADVKIITNEELEVDQSALTGESMPVLKKNNDVVYSGSIVRRGEATGVVVRTGVNTYFGKTVELVSLAKPKLHMEEIISRVVGMLLVIVGILSAVMMVATYFLTRDVFFLLTYVLPLVLVMIVFAVPVALPAMFTVTMSVGASEMAKKGALITKLSAIEDAASMTVLNADKTGTLTYNKLSIVKVVPMNGFNEEEVISYGALASQEANNDPIDLAFIRASKERKLGLDKYKVKEFHPFDPSTRRTEALVEFDSKAFRVAKGAVRTISEDLCKAPLTQEVESLMNEFASSGYRTLAVAKLENGSWKMVGLVALYDMPREDTPRLIQEIKNLGVKFKMLTGDAAPIAKEIAKMLGLGEKVITGKELRETLQKDPQKAAELAEEADVFAEIYPEDKYFIVKSQQLKKNIVGMTGDGINDAPALKQAEVGIAVSNATDVAKSAASVVLTVEGLSGIVDLIKIGRSTYQRIVTWILNKVVKTFEIAVFVAITFIFSAIALHKPIYVVSSLDIVLFLFLIDFVTISLSTDNAKGSPVPEKWNVPKLVTLGVGLGVFTVLEMFGLFLAAENIFKIQNVDVLNTYFFTAIMFMGILTPFIVRERGPFWISRPGKYLLIASVADIALVSFMALTGLPTPWGRLLAPITRNEFLFILAYTFFVNFIINDLAKRGLGKLGISR